MRFNDSNGGVTCDNLINGKRCNRLYIHHIDTSAQWEELAKERHICPECEIELAVAGDTIKLHSNINDGIEQESGSAEVGNLNGTTREVE